MADEKTLRGSLRAYARHRGESLTAVQKAIASGRIRPPARGKLDFARADAEWLRNTAPRPGRASAAVAPSSTPPVGSAALPPGSNGHSNGNGGALAYAKARSVREQFLAQLAALDFKVRSGKLVDRAKVEAAAFVTFRSLRDRLLALPDRMAPVLAAEMDQAQIRAHLDTELRKALNDFADQAAGPEPAAALAG